MVMTWNDKADAKLFVYVLKIHELKIDYAKLAAAFGQNVTAKAISHRVAKLRQIAAEDEQSESSASGAANGTSPTKKRARSVKATPSPAKTARAAATAKKSASPATDGPKKRGRKPKNPPKELTPVFEDNEERTTVANGAETEEDDDSMKYEHVETPGYTTIDEEEEIDIDEAPIKKRARKTRDVSAEEE